MHYSKPLPFIQPINIKKHQLVYTTSDNSGEAPLKNIKKLSDCWLDLGICRTTIQCIIIFPPLSGLSSLVFSHNGAKKVVVCTDIFSFSLFVFARYRSRCIKVSMILRCKKIEYNLKWIYPIKICRLSYMGYKHLQNSIWKVNCEID